MKLKFGFVKLRYRGPKKNATRGVRAGAPVSAAKEAAASGTSIARLRRLLITSQPPKWVATGEQTESERLHWHG
jgi:hypothetical protein